MTIAFAIRSLVTLLVFFGAAGCGKEVEPPPLPKLAPFVAFERDFQDFEAWAEVEAPKQEAQDVTHTEG